MHKPLFKPRPRLGDLLVRQGFLTSDQLQQALLFQAESNGTKLLGEVLVEREFCTEEQVLECLAAEFKLPFVKLDTRMFDPKAVELLPREFIDKHCVLPLFKLRDTLTVAVAEPSDVFLIDRVRAIARCDVQLAIATARDIRRTLQTYLPDGRVFVIDDIIDRAHGDSVELSRDTINDIAASHEQAGQNQINRLVSHIIHSAVKERASDIHIEPGERQIRVRFRVDGTLFKSLELPGHIAPALAARIKSMAAMDGNECRLPQEGRIPVIMDNRSINLRVSTLPLGKAEKTVIRVLDFHGTPLSLPQLAFSSEHLARFQSLTRRSSGLVLVTGPASCGKTTTMYAALSSLSSIEKNICTVEGPIESALPLVNQFEINEKIGLSYDVLLRGLLNQAPDVLMVGQIPDAATAQSAVHAALSGRLVFSTLPTHNACSAVTQLLHMGIDAHLIAASLSGVLNQRLCRRICARCKQPHEPAKPILALLQQLGLESQEFYRGAGCARCRNTGFSGRIAIHELLVVDEALREVMLHSPTNQTIGESARRAGMIPLRYDGLRKAEEGLTTIEEVLQVTGEGWLPIRE